MYKYIITIFYSYPNPVYYNEQYSAMLHYSMNL